MWITSNSATLSDAASKTLADHIACAAETLYGMYGSVRGGKSAPEYAQIVATYNALPFERKDGSKRSGGDNLYLNIQGVSGWETMDACAMFAYIAWRFGADCLGGVVGSSDNCLYKSARTGTGGSQKTVDMLSQSGAAKDKNPSVGSIMLRISETNAGNGHAGVVVGVQTGSYFETIEANGAKIKADGSIVERRRYNWSEIDSLQCVFLHAENCPVANVPNESSFCCPPTEKTEEPPTTDTPPVSCPPAYDCPPGYRRRQGSEEKYKPQNAAVQTVQQRASRDGYGTTEEAEYAFKMAQITASEREAYFSMLECCVPDSPPRRVTAPCPPITQKSTVMRIGDCKSHSYRLNYPDSDAVPHFSTLNSADGRKWREGFLSSRIEVKDLTARYNASGQPAYMNYIQAVPTLKSSNGLTFMSVVSDSALDKVLDGLKLYPKNAVWIRINRTATYGIGVSYTGAGFAERLANDFFTRSSRMNYRGSSTLFSQDSRIKTALEQAGLGNIWQSWESGQSFPQNCAEMMEHFEMFASNPSIASALTGRAIIFYFDGEPVTSLDVLSSMTNVLATAASIIPFGGALAGQIVSAVIQSGSGIAQAAATGTLNAASLFNAVRKLCEPFTSNPEFAKEIGVSPDVFQGIYDYSTKSQRVYERYQANGVAGLLAGAEAEFNISRTLPQAMGLTGEAGAAEAFLRGAYRDVNAFWGANLNTVKESLHSFIGAVPIDAFKNMFALDGGASSALSTLIQQNYATGGQLTIARLAPFQDLIGSRPGAQSLTVMPGFSGLVSAMLNIPSITATDVNTPEMFRTLLGAATGRLALDSHLDQITLDSFLYKAEDFAKKGLKFDVPPIIDECKAEYFQNEIDVCIGYQCKPPKVLTGKLCIPPQTSSTPPTAKTQEECFDVVGGKLVYWRNAAGDGKTMQKCIVRARLWQARAGGMYAGVWLEGVQAQALINGLISGDYALHISNGGGQSEKSLVELNYDCAENGQWSALPEMKTQYRLCVAKDQTQTKECVPPPCIVKRGNEWFYCPTLPNATAVASSSSQPGLSDRQEIEYLDHATLQRLRAALGSRNSSVRTLSDAAAATTAVYNPNATQREYETNDPNIYISNTGTFTAQDFNAWAGQSFGNTTATPDATPLKNASATNEKTNGNGVASSYSGDCHPAKVVNECMPTERWYALIKGAWADVTDCSIQGQLQCCEDLEKAIENLRKDVATAAAPAAELPLLRNQLRVQREMLEKILERTASFSKLEEKIDRNYDILTELSKRPSCQTEKGGCDLAPVLQKIEELKKSSNTVNYDDSKLIEKIEYHTRILREIADRPQPPDRDYTVELQRQRDMLLQILNRVNDYDNSSLYALIYSLTQKFNELQPFAERDTAIREKLEQTYQLIVKLINKPLICPDNSELSLKIEQFLRQPPCETYNDSELRAWIAAYFEQFKQLQQQKQDCPSPCKDCPSPCKDFDDRLVQQKLDETKEILVRLYDKPQQQQYDDSVVRQILTQIFEKVKDPRTVDFSNVENKLNVLIDRKQADFSNVENKLDVLIERQPVDLTGVIQRLDILLSRSQSVQTSTGEVIAYDDSLVRNMIEAQTALIKDLQRKTTEQNTRFESLQIRERLDAQMQKLTSIMSIVERGLTVEQLQTSLREISERIQTLERANSTELVQKELQNHRELLQAVQSLLVDVKTQTAQNTAELQRLNTSVQQILAQLRTVSNTNNIYDDSAVRAKLDELKTIVQTIECKRCPDCDLTHLQRTSAEILNAVIALSRSATANIAGNEGLREYIAELIRELSIQTAKRDAALATAVEALKKDIAEHRTENRHAAEQTMSLIQTISSIDSKINNLASIGDLNALFSKVINLERLSQQILNNSTAYDDTSLKNMITALQTTTTDIRSRVSSATTATGEKIDMSGMTDSMQRIEKTVKELQSRREYDDSAILVKLDAQQGMLRQIVEKQFIYDDRELRNQMDRLHTAIAQLHTAKETASTTTEKNNIESRLLEISAGINELRSRRQEIYSDSAIREILGRLETGMNELRSKQWTVQSSGGAELPGLQRSIDEQSAMLRELIARKCTTYDDGELKSMVLQILQKPQTETFNDAELRKELGKLRNDYVDLRTSVERNLSLLAEQSKTQTCGDCKEKFDELAAFLQKQDTAYSERMSLVGEQLQRLKTSISSPSIAPPPTTVPPVLRNRTSREAQEQYISATDCPDCPVAEETISRKIWKYPARAATRRRKPCTNC